MILEKIQKDLETLYAFKLDQNVKNFLTQTGKQKGSKKVGGRFHNEALIIKQNEGDIEVALFIHPKLLQQLKADNPYANLNLGNLEPFLIATEGVSHFLYFISRAEKQLPVTQLEMELQAEVDKYLLACFLYYHQHKIIPPFLFSTLFENFRWHNELSNEEISRYKKANALAAKFCNHLQTHYLRTKRWQELLEVVRQFYHMNHWAKIRSLTP